MKSISLLKKTSPNVICSYFAMKYVCYIVTYSWCLEYPQENVNKECKTSTPEQNIKQTAGAIVAIVVISAVVIVMLAVISVIIIYFYFKKRTSDMTL